MKRIDASRAIGGYAAVMTALAGWLSLGGAADPMESKPTRFDTIDVRRINVRENDGTLRMVIAGRDNIGGMIVEDREFPHPGRTQAGMIFYNDEGTENGGLIFDGRLKNGQPTNSGSLTFDRWRQDQTVQMRTIEDGPRRSAGFVVNDRPDRSLDFDKLGTIRAMPNGPPKDAAYEAAGFGGTQRVYLGSRDDHSAELALRDAAGRPRLILRVEADGMAAIQFRNASGATTRTVSAIP